MHILSLTADEKPWKEEQPNQQNSGDGKKNQATQTEDTSPSEKVTLNAINKTF